MEYEIVKNEYDDVQGCYSCGCEVPLHGFDWGPPYNEPHETDKIMLCEICASTHIGSSARRGYTGHETARIIAQVANHLIDKLGKR